MEHYKKEQVRKQLKGYIVGFVLSLTCTFLAFGLVYAHVHQMVFSYGMIIALLGVLAFSQFVVQLVYFLHLSAEQRPRWKLLVFWFMILVVLIVVVGSLWIMHNLNYNMMPAPENMNVETQRGF